MTAAVCVDTRNGMAFGGRRQSRDRLLCADLIRLCGKVRMLPSSAELFSEFPDAVELCGALLREEGVYFVETDSLETAQPEELILYRWNRLYPADLWLRLDPAERGMRLISSVEFAGSSHPRITREIWRMPDAER